MLILSLLFYAGLLCLAVATGWLVLLTFGAWRYRALTDPAAPLLTLGVIIPACNEELQIAQTIANVRRCDYPAERLRLIVIADNCSDATAQYARAAGARVVERQNLQQRGKGQALDWFLKHCQNLYACVDGLVFVDADVQPERNMFRELSASLAHPAVQVVQGFNGVANPDDNWRTALNAAAFNVFNHLRMAGNCQLFGSAMLKGLGMAFKTELLSKYGWPAHSVVEDMEFTLQLTADRVAIHYNPAAIITSEMAASRAQADSQRRRWEGGRLRLARQVLPGLFGKLLAGQFRQLPLIMDLLIPPLSLLVMLLSGWTLLAWGFFPTLLPLCLLLVLCVTGYVVSGQLQRKMPLRHWGYLLAAPLFVAWKLLVYASMLFDKKKDTWVRTLRKAELAPDLQSKHKGTANETV